MNAAELSATIHDILLKHAKIPVESIATDDQLVRDLGFDSLAFVLALTDVELRVGLKFPLDHVDELAHITFAELLALVTAGLPGVARS